jgi:FdhD protein
MSAPLAEEVVVRLTLNGAPSYEWRCTPADIEAMIIGRLYIDGRIAHADAVHLSVERGEEEIRATARIETTPTLVSQNKTSESLAIPPTEVFGDLFRELFNAVDARHESGGMHAAAATDGMRIVRQVEDVGRHNTIDKIVGIMVLDNLPFRSAGLLTSSRVSGEIADKAARAGFSWLASRSIPTTLAARVARAAHMPIIGRAASKNAFTYS